MYRKQYEWMVPRIGEKAATAGLQMQYSNVLLAVVGLGGILVTYLGPMPTQAEIYWLLSLVAVAAAVVVYAQIRFARALSEYFKTKVRWYRTPFVTQTRLFNKWLEEIHDDPSSKS
jgi:hypothetical protein